MPTLEASTTTLRRHEAAGRLEVLSVSAVGFEANQSTCVSAQVAPPTDPSRVNGHAAHIASGTPVTCARVEQALRIVAEIVAGPDGEAYLPIFERLEGELATLEAQADTLARARRVAASTPRFSPSTPRGA